ncbi:MAG TPA: hypothetical protein VGB25_03865 [Candidatus Binatia bacterium]
MIVDLITELSLVGVYDRGVPNEERIVLVARDSINMGQYGVMLGIRSVAGSAFPIRDNLLWFGDAQLTNGDWIFIYTGPGEPRSTNLPGINTKIYTVHWGRDKTVLHDQNVVPILFRVDAVQVAVPLAELANTTVGK